MAQNGRFGALKSANFANNTAARELSGRGSEHNLESARCARRNAGLAIRDAIGVKAVRTGIVGAQRRRTSSPKNGTAFAHIIGRKKWLMGKMAR